MKIKTIDLMLPLLLVFNIVVTTAVLFSGSAKQEEIKKAWGIENYNKIVELFDTDAYKMQQAKAIGNFEAQLIESTTTK